jgi:hypothetical protein
VQQKKVHVPVIQQAISFHDEVYRMKKRGEREGGELLGWHTGDASVLLPSLFID